MIEATVAGATLTVSAEGDLDLAERARFPELTARAAASDVDVVVVDLCSVEFVDSAGAAFLITLAETAKRSGARAVLRGADERVGFVLDLCGALDSYEVDAEHRCAPSTGPGPWRSPTA
ncbi:STAS domain-containing protein [Quadrisphaera setariae]|uniref:STAS domain-containing protein n=1 Tax=Quadrisphaera setariae TaxID=2593304 RepID=A0A5C8ZFM2_9ACTN|nr:STAS domain-containing protein [Quadrisphaera setariae]TXR56059.1 STAS domain-containing protein [Quadrisphaera setariae]